MDGKVFASRSFALAGIYGTALLLPRLSVWGERRSDKDWAPIGSSPVYYFGFVSGALTWQLGFLVMARDPVRYRALMPVAVLEKLVFAGSCAMLAWQGRLQPTMKIAAVIDASLGALFVAAYVLTRNSK
jgi:hypothetical protein